MAERQPAAFMSYLRRVDEHDRGRLTELRKLLEGEVGVYTGESFAIFQDRQDIKWGEQWRRRIHESLDDVTFLVPIITPGFFASKPCREELELFLKREKDLGRSDLILPIYYIDYPDFNDTEQRGRDPLMAEVAKHQYEDWRELRHEPLTSAEVGRKLSHLAEAVRDALNRRRPVVAIPGDGPSEATPAERGQAPAQSQTSGAGAEKLRAGGGTQAGSAPAAKSEPPTLVVNPFHRGDYTSISDAVRAAKPGTVIKVEPGLYREGLVIDKPLEIVGQGAVGDVVIEVANKNVILFQATMGRVANVSLRQLGGKFYAVDIAQGRLDLEDCDITSQGLACVGIHGGADPRLRRNRIHDGKRAGVLVYENGRGTLEDNDIFANAYVGVEIRSGGDPTLRRNRIHDGKSAGVLVYENGRGTLEDNEVFANANAGVAIGSGGDPTLRRNRIHDGPSGGVLVYDNGRGTLEDNDVFANAGAGVLIASGGAPTLRRNRIHDGKQSGVYVYENGRGTLEDNEVFANALAGVEIRSGGDPTLRRNRIHDGKQGGVYVNENGRGTLEDNDIFANAYAGVAIRSGGDPTLRRNRIHDGKQGGVAVYENGCGTLEDNDIFANANAGVAIESGGNPTLRRNRIHDGKEAGVNVYENGCGTLEDNDIFANANAGVAIESGGNPTLRRNRIHKNSYEAVWVYEGGGGTFEDNDLTDNQRGAWDIAEDCREKVVRRNNKE